MTIVEAYLEMLKYPNSPKPYRVIRDFYKKMGRTHESEAFSHLIEMKFKELNDNHDDLDEG